MSNNLAVTQALPATACTRQNIYDLINTANPGADLPDDATIEIIANQLAATLNVPRWVKVGDAVEHTDLQAAAENNTYSLFTLPGKGVIHAVKIKASTAFAGTGITSYKLSVGIVGALTKYAAPFDVLQAVGDDVFAFNHEQGAETHDAAGKGIVLSAVSEGADLDQSSAGVVDVWVLYSKTI